MLHNAVTSLTTVFIADQYNFFPVHALKDVGERRSHILPEIIFLLITAHLGCIPDHSGARMGG